MKGVKDYLGLGLGWPHIRSCTCLLGLGSVLILASASCLAVGSGWPATGLGGLWAKPKINFFLSWVGLLTGFSFTYLGLFRGQLRGIFLISLSLVLSALLLLPIFLH